jgi:ubiquinone biosynthesis protein UbiJ
MAMIPNPAASTINHILAATPLAKERLAKFAGKTAEFHVGPMVFALTVQTTGEVTAAVAQAARDLEVRVSPFLLPRLAMNEEAAYREVVMQGDSDFAGEIGYLARHVKWDVEEDLSRVVGDIAAHRLVSGARAAAAYGRDTSERLAAGAAEYWTEEDPLIASRVKVEQFGEDVDALRDAVERLEKRVDRLRSPKAN